MAFDAEKMHKLPREYRFPDLNELWYFTYPWVVRTLYPLPVTANQITFLSLVLGLTAAGFYVGDSPQDLCWAAGFLYGKLLLDNVDGNLARARGEVSRLGRFFDSFTDITVHTAVYLAMAFRLVGETGNPLFWVWGLCALASALLQCSYFVYYLVNYTSRVGTYTANRADETPTESDRRQRASGRISPSGYFLQRFHNLAYGWQDRAVEGLDRLGKNLASVENRDADSRAWYMEKRFLTLISPLCICTNTMGLVICSLWGRLDIALYLTVFAGNVYLAAAFIWKILHFKFSPRR